MDLSPASLFFGIVYGSVAVAMLQIGRKRASAPLLLLGFALLALSVSVGSTWWSWPLGAGLAFVGFKYG